MSDIETIVDPEVEARNALRQVKIACQLQAIEAEVRVLELASATEELDAPCFATTWMYVPRSDADPATEKAAALAWLRRHAAGFRRIARVIGEPGRVEKFADGRYLGVRCEVDSVSLRAEVPASVTCEMVDTGETAPVMKRVCPPSIYADLDPAEALT